MTIGIVLGVTILAAWYMTDVSKPRREKPRSRPRKAEWKDGVLVSPFEPKE